MWRVIQQLFSVEGYRPRGAAAAWTPAERWACAAADAATWAALVTIFVVLVYCAWRKKVPFPGTLWLFAIFLLVCGGAYFLDALSFWWPADRLSALFRVATAVISWATAIAVVYVAPRALRMRMPEELEKEVRERRRAEAALLERDERLSLSLKAAGAGTWDWHPADDRIQCDEHLPPLFGLRPGEFPDRLDDFLALLHPDDRQRVRAEIAAAVERDSEYDIQFRTPWPDRSMHFVRARGKVFRDERGRPFRMSGVCWDVTRRALAEQQARHERELLSQLMDNVPDSIYFKDLQSRFLRINAALARRLGLSHPSEALGKTDFDFFHEDHARPAFEDEQRIIRTGQPLVNKEEREVWPDGRQCWVSSTKLPLRDAFGRTIGTLGISRDITVQKGDEEALRRAKDAAEAASHAKSLFVANMSHEIRTPMNAIIGLAELVAATDLSAEQREYLQMIQQSAESLLSVINDILDFSKIEADKLELHASELDLREMVGDCLRPLAFRAGAKDIELAYCVAPEVPARATADGSRLRQVLVNLVGNAIKFTDVGEVIVRVGQESAVNDSATLVFSVADTGIGIPADKLERVFLAFEQGDASMSRQFGGTGLGLAISRRLVEIMGGRIEVRSEPGRGSTFTFTVPVAHPVYGPAGWHKAASSLAGLRVLIADDHATSRHCLAEMLRGVGMDVSEVGDASGLTELVAQAEGRGAAFDFVLIDSRLAGLDGHRVARDLLATVRPSAKVYAMLSIGEQPTGLAQCHEWGIAGGFIKPIKLSEIFEEFARALGLAAPTAGREAPPAAPPTRRLRVLLAEDSLVNQKLAAGILERHGHEVHLVNNGRDAVEAVKRGSFDAVLMDVQMPVLDGLEATRQIRQWEAGTSPPRHVLIIALTAHAMQGDRDRCLAAGMDEYLSKPIRSADLAAALGSLHLAGAPGPVPDPHSSPGDRVEFSVEALYGALGGDETLGREVVRVFLAEAPRLLAGIDRAIREGQAAELERLAHTLKGSLGYFGADRTWELARQLEICGKSSRLEEAPETWQELRPLVERLTMALRARFEDS